MNATKAFLFLSILAATSANAATFYDVTFSYETPSTIGDGSFPVPTSGGGSGSAVLGDDGVLRMTLHGEILSNYSGFFAGPAYTNIITDTTVLLNTTDNGNGTYSLVRAGSYTRYSTCTPGPLENLGSCIALRPGTTDWAFDTDAFYSTQSFDLNGGMIRVGQYRASAALFTDYTLTAVPLPASSWVFGSAVCSLFGWVRQARRIRKVTA